MIIKELSYYNAVACLVPLANVKLCLVRLFLSIESNQTKTKPSETNSGAFCYIWLLYVLNSNILLRDIISEYDLFTSLIEFDTVIMSFCGIYLQDNERIISALAELNSRIDIN